MTVSAFVISENWMKCKVSRDASVSSNEIEVARVSGAIQVGDRYLLKGSEHAEPCVVSEVSATGKTVGLASPLEQEYPRGSWVLPYVQTTSDSRGEVVIAFRNCRSKTFDVHLAVGIESIKEVVRAAEGETLYLRKIMT
jgi:hypothetical protein